MKELMTSHFLTVLKIDKIDPRSIRVIFDVGSRDGKQAIELADEFTGASVFAFECNPETLPQVFENIRNYPRVSCIPVAVTDFDGEVDFFKVDRERTQTPHGDGNPGASSLFKANDRYPLEKYVQTPIKVPCRSLDSICNEKAIEAVDLMWMDLQGAELKALKGFSTRLGSVRYIHVELTHKEIYAGQPLFPEVDAFLQQQGFERLFEPMENCFFEDCIYRNKRFFNISSNRVVLEQPWGGLGDNLQFSTLPELYSRKNVDFYLSCSNRYRNREILASVWGGNPYVRGFVNEPGTVGASVNQENLERFRKDIPFIGRIEMAHGFKPTHKYPVIYERPRVREDVAGRVIVDLSSVTYGAENEKLLRYVQSVVAWYKYRVEDFLQVRFSNYTAQKGLVFGNIPQIEVDSLAEYSEILFSASIFITVHSGAKSLAVALRNFRGSRLQKIHCFASSTQYNFRDYIYDDVIYHVE